jgi:hypothetical protein
MNRAELVTFLRRHRLCVQASVSPASSPQAALVGFAVSDQLEIVFDTLDSTRKSENLRQNSRIALVVGLGPEERTAQIEGIADRPSGAELERLKRVYFEVWPDGVARQTWKGLTYVRVRPTWVRYSDFAHAEGPEVVEVEI